MTNPFLSRGNPKDKGRHGRKAESLVSKRLGGSQQPGSGALAGAKGDVTKEGRAGRFLIENKASSGKSFSLPRDWLYKIYQEAAEQQRIPALAFQFTNEGGLSERRERWVAFPEHVALALMNGDEF